jgi:hypothetical protein
MDINFGNAQNTHPPKSPNRSQHNNSKPIMENAMLNANDRSIHSNKKTSLPLLIFGSAREVGRDAAGNAGSGDPVIDGDSGQGSTASNIF